MVGRVLEIGMHWKWECTFQSAYRKYHSTETALIAIQNYIISSLDIRKVTVVIYLLFTWSFCLFDNINFDVHFTALNAGLDFLVMLSDGLHITSTVLLIQSL